MTKDELLKKLEDLRADSDVEGAHWEADQALLEYVNDTDIAEAYRKIKKWYA